MEDISGESYGSLDVAANKKVISKDKKYTYPINPARWNAHQISKGGEMKRRDRMTW